MVTFADKDHDGVADFLDNCIDNPNIDQNNFDLDSLGDECDSDDDNDGFSDDVDAFDNESSEWSDFDFDGIGSEKDQDDDNDGIIDPEDTVPTLPSEYLARKYLQEIQDCTIMDDGPPRLCYSQFFGRVAENEENNSDALELSIAL
ncbi:MAG: thrombospondin type 3 repeat-containing protein, partial [Nitrosopumilus sp.]|nr:thrombospondin type 3 repeat-containing protein [Nitrosopumilus sp.]